MDQTATKLIYTFAWFPGLSELQEISDVFVFSNRLNADLEVLKKKVLREKSTKIIGIASSKYQRSYIETVTVNSFNKGKVSKQNGAESYSLYAPPHNGFVLRKKGTNGFCNWTIFKLAEFLEAQELSTQLSFYHLSKPFDFTFLHI